MGDRPGGRLGRMGRQGREWRWDMLYRTAATRARTAWYRREATARKNHSFVDMVDSLKLSVYANAVLCLK